MTRCIDCMDYSCDWDTWRQNLHKNLTGNQHFYWQDEAIQNMAERLNAFINRELTINSPKNDIVLQMWDVANPEERKSLAMVLLKLIESH